MTWLQATEIAFWVALLFLVHTYFTFPLSLPVLVEFFARHQPWKGDGPLPRVSILISAFNEAGVIERKIENCLALDYPPELLEILIGDDGSTDQTAEIVERYSPRVRLVRAPKNRGKASMLNQLRNEATGSVFLFCDANTMFFPNVVRKIVQPFSDPKVGCVCGRLVLTDSSGSALGEGETAYWDLESEIKKFEGMLDIVIGGNGAVYAIRSELYTELPVQRAVMDDFFITVQVLQRGYRSTYLSSAIGTEQTSKEGSGEFRRKVRIGRANFNYLHRYLPLLNPLRPLVAYSFLSHKLLRWFSPHLMVVTFLSSAALSWHNRLYAFAFLVQALLLGLAVIGKLQQGTERKSMLTLAPYYLLAMNYAMLVGFLQSFRPQSGGGWSRELRSDEMASGESA